jgi:hypothetical protein
MKKYKILIILCCLLFSITESYADNLCVKKNIKANPQNGRVSLARAFKTVGDNEECPRGFTEIVNTSLLKGEKGDKGDKGDIGTTGATGAKGDKGDAGKSGGFYLNTCVTETKTSGVCANGFSCNTQLKCGEGTGGSEQFDYMAHYAWKSDNNATKISNISTAYTVYNNGEYQYPTGVTLSSQTGGAGSHTLTVEIVCCLPN